MGIECKEVKWCEVNWREFCEVVLFWSEVKCVTVNLVDKSAMYITATLYWVYLIILWLFFFFVYLVLFVLTCCVMCGCVGVWVFWRYVYFTVFCIIVLCFLYCFVYVYLFLFVLSVLVWGLLPPGDNLIAVSSKRNIFFKKNQSRYWPGVAQSFPGS